MIAVPVITPAAYLATPAIRQGQLAPPWMLTASDGSGLALVRVDAHAVVEGPLAFTELHLYFRNPEDRVREGAFQITLPVGAAVSRFAMEDAGHWREAEVVPRLVARRAYDDFLHRRQDPALLEQAAGNQFTAKVFPIAARSEKHLVISYSQELPGMRYQLPLRGLPRAERIDVELAFTAADGSRAVQRLAERDWAPDRDFVATSPVTAAAVTAGGLVAAQIEVAARPGAAGRDVPRGVTLLVDTSASRSLGFSAYVASVRALIGALAATWGGDLPLAVVAFDQDAELIFEGRAGAFGEPGAQKLIERGAAGASDIGQALAFVADSSRRKVLQSRVAIVGDGVITAGAEGKDLQAAVARLAAAGVERIDVVLAGGLRDDRAAALIIDAGLPRPGAVLDLDIDPVATALGEPVAADVAIEVAGATWVYPRRIASARAGAKLMVFARLPGPVAALATATGARPAVPSHGGLIDIVAGGQHHAIRALAGTTPLVERAIARAELAELEARLAVAPGAEVAGLRTAIAAKSVATRVLSSETSLLVLESDADYRRYKIERSALADVLVVGPRGIERLPRVALDPGATQVADPATAPARDDSPNLPASARSPGAPAADLGPAAGPPPDSDQDGLPDAADACPDPASHGGTDDDGCPVRRRVVTTDSDMVVLDYVYFEADQAAIRPSSYPALDAVAETMLRYPTIALVEIQGHADERGAAAAKLELSDRRAATVKDYLVARGVAADRLAPVGYGDTMPIDRRHTASARAKNRRVGFLITKRGPDPSDGATPAASTASGTQASNASSLAASPSPPAAVTGELAAIQHALAAHQLDAALATARDWHAREPANVLALIGLGETYEARHAGAAAARIYGSIIDLFPGRADMRRFAGERLARLASARDLAIDTYRRAVADRPDHLTGHRLLAYALVAAGRPSDAFAAILAGLDQTYRSGSYAGGLRVLGDDAGMIGAAYAAAVPAKRREIIDVLARHKLALATRPSTRFLLYWETDANDVDLHIRDSRGGHAYYQEPRLASGGELYADVTTGYGPECFAIPGSPQAGPYQLSLEYFSQGPMGYGMGVLDIQTFDPTRGITLEHRPYVIMTNHAKLDLGTYR
jgi:outer membrane protein OmpA-like peptidoglycan-associated protein